MAGSLAERHANDHLENDVTRMTNSRRKRAIRQRMIVTGENYMTAMRALDKERSGILPPSSLHTVTPGDGESRAAALAELSQLGQELGDMPAQVCVTHLRFIPCRRNDGTCVVSSDAGDVERTRAYQRS